MATANASEHLPASLRNILDQIIDRVNKADGGIRVILLRTAEGAPLGRFYAPGQAQILNPEILANVESIWAPASKQLPLLNLGKDAKVISAVFDHVTVVHVYQLPIVITILLQPNSNMGAVRSTAIPLLKENLEPLCKTLLNSLRPEEDWQGEDAAYQGQSYYQ